MGVRRAPNVGYGFRVRKWYPKAPTHKGLVLPFRRWHSCSSTVEGPRKGWSLRRALAPTRSSGRCHEVRSAKGPSFATVSTSRSVPRVDRRMPHGYRAHVRCATFGGASIHTTSVAGHPRTAATAASNAVTDPEAAARVSIFACMLAERRISRCGNKRVLINYRTYAGARADACVCTVGVCTRVGFDMARMVCARGTCARADFGRGAGRFNN